MNIGIFDTEHFETTYTLIRLSQLPGRQIFVFTDTHCQQRLSESLNIDAAQVHWIVQQPSESHRQFIRKMNTLVRELDIQLLFYNTISNNHLLHALLLRNNRTIRTVLTVHDINDLTYYTPVLSLQNLYRNTGRRQLLKRISELNVISDTMIPYLSEKVSNRHIIHNIPGAVFEQATLPLAITNSVNLVIPGTIDKKRRDYLHAFELLINADAAQLPLNITFLGAPYNSYGRDIVKIARGIHLNHASVKVYDAEVSQPEFDAVMRQAHFVFIPSARKSYEHLKPVEIYGETKSSGGIFDAVRHAKPLIIPTFLKVPGKIEKRCMRYGKVSEIIVFLKNLYSQPGEYRLWQQNALDSSKEFTIEKIRNAHPSLFS